MFPPENFNNPAHPAKSGNPFRLTDTAFFKNGHYGTRVLLKSIEKLTGLGGMARTYANLPPSDTPEAFAANVLAHYDISHQLMGGSLPDIPATGPLLILANHPFGGVEGLVLLHLLRQRRKDVKVVANALLARIPELSSSFISVNPYPSQTATRYNARTMREALDWLKNQGALIIFPAGDVAAFQPGTLRITEGKWDKSIARLIRLSKAATVPVFIDGRNSLLFHALGKLHPRLRTALYPREVLNKAGRKIHLWIGPPLASPRLLKIGNDNEIAKYLRLRSHMLKSRRTRRCGNTKPASLSGDVTCLIAPRPKSLLIDEIHHLSPACKLASSTNLDVYIAHASQIPNTLKEIGRLRELTFRANGEGTGKSVDLDLFDRWYRHLFLWNRETHEIAGAYRLGLGDEIMRLHGRKGFYSQSLFRFKSSFPQALNPEIELGRSFVCTNYQKSMTPMMLLWKGIGAFMVQNPQYAVLFGPVSISNAYTSLSQQLLIDFLRCNHFDDPLRKHIKPRKPFRSHQSPLWRKSDLTGLGSISGISELVSCLEKDGKGAPVLIRHYLNIGGRMLGFNVDRNFGNCIDAMVVVDLRKAHKRILNRYMGQEGAARFLAYHARKLPLAS